MATPEQLQHFHNQGEKDASKGVHSLPGWIAPGGRMILRKKRIKHIDDCNEAYQKGHDNTTSQNSGK